MLLLTVFAATAWSGPPDVEGEWVIIGDHEATRGSVRVISCLSRRPTWRFETVGVRVTATYVPGRVTTGMLRSSTTTVSGSLEGAWTDATLRLDGEEVWTTAYRFDSRESTQQRHERHFVLTMKGDHLVGTLSGKPVRLAPADLTEAERPCGPVPP